VFRYGTIRFGSRRSGVRFSPPRPPAPPQADFLLLSRSISPSS